MLSSLLKQYLYLLENGNKVFLWSPQLNNQSLWTTSTMMESTSTNNDQSTNLNGGGVFPLAPTMVTSITPKSRGKKSRKGLLDSSSHMDKSTHSKRERRHSCAMDMSGHSVGMDASTHSVAGRRHFRNSRQPSFRVSNSRRSSISAEEQAVLTANAKRRLASQISLSDAEQFSFAADESWLEFCEDLTLDEIKWTLGLVTHAAKCLCLAMAQMGTTALQWRGNLRLGISVCLKHLSQLWISISLLVPIKVAHHPLAVSVFLQEKQIPTLLECNPNV